MRKIINQITPFILLGTGIVAFALGIMLFAYLLLFGAILGGILYLANWIRESYFRKKKPLHKVRQYRVIDSDEWERKK